MATAAAAAARPPRVVSAATARAFLVKHLHLHAYFPPGIDGVRAMLKHLRCVQIDPLDKMGSNPDLVTMARVCGVKRGEVGHLLRGHAFEHWAKERCFIAASAFPAYARYAPETVWWKSQVRSERVSDEIVKAVLQEVTEKGPVKATELEDRGAVKPLDWSGWKSTAKAASMALDILWTQCRIVVLRDEQQRKIFDLPHRALQATELCITPVPSTHAEFIKWAILERVHAAGFLSRNAGAYWSVLSEHRDGSAVRELIDEGLIEEVQVEGYNRRYLAPRGWSDAQHGDYDNEARILGPLDPLLWDRVLLQHAFNFEYIWEVYKPQEQRRWGYYVCPVLLRDAFLGRIEGDVKEDSFTVRKVWLERNLSDAEKAAFLKCLQRHAENCQAKLVLEASLEQLPSAAAAVLKSSKKKKRREKKVEELSEEEESDEASSLTNKRSRPATARSTVAVPAAAQETTRKTRRQRSTV